MSLHHPAGLETIWLIRHLVVSLSSSRPVPPHVARTLHARALTMDDALLALSELSRVMPRPIRVGPPCSSAWTSDESHIANAAAALAGDDTTPVAAAIAALAVPRGLTGAQSRRALAAITRLAGHGPSLRDRCSRGNGGVAIARTASETSASALSSPATRFERSSPHC